MTDDSETGGQSNQPASGNKDCEADSAEEQARRSDDLACRLAYECGWRLCDDSLRTLEAQRTRSVALLSVTMVAAGVAASAFLGYGIGEDLGCATAVGAVLFAAGTLGVAASTVRVAWPIESQAAFRPAKIIKNYVDLQQPGRKPSWVYKHLARDLDKAYKDMRKELKRRNLYYKCAVACAAAVLVGAGIVLLDAAF